MLNRERGKRKALVGRVVSDKMDKTVVVEITTRVRHARYNKYVSRRTKYQAHDEQNNCGIGDTVQIIESRPMSRCKRWRVQTILRKAL